MKSGEVLKTKDGEYLYSLIDHGWTPLQLFGVSRKYTLLVMRKSDGRIFTFDIAGKKREMEKAVEFIIDNPDAAISLIESEGEYV